MSEIRIEANDDRVCIVRDLPVSRWGNAAIPEQTRSCFQAGIRQGPARRWTVAGLGGRSKCVP